MSARHFVLTLVFSHVVALVYAQDQNIAGFKAPTAIQNAPAHLVPANPDSASAVVSSPQKSVLNAPSLPPRVLFETPHGVVVADGLDLVFKFAKAPIPEAVGMIGRAFGLSLVYAGPSEREVSAEWRCALPEEALGRLVDRTNLQFHIDGSVGTVGELALEAPKPIDFASLVTRDGAPPGSPVTAPAK